MELDGKKIMALIGFQVGILMLSRQSTMNSSSYAALATFISLDINLNDILH